MSEEPFLSTEQSLHLELEPLFFRGQLRQLRLGQSEHLSLFDLYGDTMYQRLMNIQPGNIGETSPGSGCPLKGLMVASKAQPLHKQVIKTWVNKDSFEPGGGWQACHLPASQ